MSMARKIVLGALLIAIGGLITYGALKYFNFGYDITGSDIEVSERTTEEEEADPIQQPAVQPILFLHACQFQQRSVSDQFCDIPINLRHNYAPF